MFRLTSEPLTQNRTEVDEIMFHETGAFLLDKTIHRVDASGIVVIEPGTEDPVAAKLSAVLVREDVVAIVASRPVKLERPEKFTRKHETRDRADAAIRMVSRLLEHELDVLLVEGCLLTAGQRYLGTRFDRKVFGPKIAM